jgi:hypothetical protein
MRGLLALGIVPLALHPAWAAGPERALTVRFVALDGPALAAPRGDGHLDFGSVAATPDRGRTTPIVVRQRIALRLDGAAGGARSARVSVALKAPTPGCVVRVDGIAISLLPRLVDPMHRIGTDVVHQLEVTVAANVPPGTFLNDLEWLAERD